MCRGAAIVVGKINSSGMIKADVQKDFEKQIYVFVSEKIDFLLCEVRIGTGDMLTVVRNI